MSNQTRTYTKKERNMYLTGMLGQNLIYNIVATGLYFYFQNVNLPAGNGFGLDFCPGSCVGRHQ